jgi:hypothetical protein
MRTSYGTSGLDSTYLANVIRRSRSVSVMRKRR